MGDPELLDPLLLLNLLGLFRQKTKLVARVDTTDIPDDDTQIILALWEMVPVHPLP